MNYVVLDLEWNQSIGKRNMVTEPVYLLGEIIQIGAAKTDENFNIIDTFRIVVKPEYYTHIHRQVALITGLDNDDLKHGYSFSKAIELFRRWCGEDFEFMIWGSNDIPMLKDNIRLHSDDYSWIPVCYNLQVMFDKQITKAGKPLSLEAAIELLGEKSFNAHDALADAYNTAIICKHLDMPKGLASYEDDYFNSLKSAITDEISVPLTQIHDNKKSLYDDPSVKSFSCPICGETIDVSEWIKQNNSNNISISSCKNGHEILTRIHFRKRYDETFLLSRQLFNANDSNKLLYAKKKDQQEKAYMAYLKKKVRLFPIKASK